jgi:hypothetical protein
MTELRNDRISAPIAAFIMNVTRTASAAFTAEFESEEELREEQRTNLSMGGLRLTTSEVVPLNMKTGQWMASIDVRVGLIHNAKTPPAFALRILPMLPDSEVRSIARAGSNMALKTAALRQLQGR